MPAYNLIPEPVPSHVGGGRPVVYLQMISDFAALKEESVRIAYPRKPDTVYNGLETALRKHQEFKLPEEHEVGDSPEGHQSHENRP